MQNKKSQHFNKEVGKGAGILVVGAGMSGITAALEAAEAGYKVILIEQLPYLGGKAIEMNQYFPKLCPPYCGMEINFQRIKNNPRISIFTSTVVKNISGSEGNFIVSLETQPEFVSAYCTLCDKCVEVCPAERPDSFNYGMNNTKAVYLPHELACPARYVIDGETCMKPQCNKCVDVCSYNAIDLSQTVNHFEIKVGAIVFTTGWKTYETILLEDMRFGEHPDIITNMMMERMAAPNGPTNGKVLCRSNGIPPKKIVFAQCAGSRDENYLPYCSGVCCSASLKQALYIVENDPDAVVIIFYVDLRVAGRNEDFLNKAEDHPRIELIKGKVAAVEKGDNSSKPIIIAEDIMSGKKMSFEADLVILATGIVPNVTGPDMIKYSAEGFIIPSQLKSGIYTAGCAKKPMDISASVKDATGAALKAIQSVS